MDTSRQIQTHHHHRHQEVPVPQFSIEEPLGQR